MSAVDSSKSSGMSVQFEKYTVQSKEGMALMERFGLGSVPAVIVNDRAIRFGDYSGDNNKLKALVISTIKDASRRKNHVSLERKVSGAGSGGRMKVVTSVTNLGTEPLEAVLKGGICDGVKVISGSASWQGRLVPGEKQDIVYEALVSDNVKTLPPQALSYTDQGVAHSLMGHETPLFLPGKLSIGAVFLAGLVAGFNPCLLAIMAFVSAMALSVNGRRWGIIINLIAFCGGLLSIYLVMGIGFLRLMEYVPSVNTILKSAIIILMVALAAWAFYDAYRTNKEGDRPSILKSFLNRYKPVYQKFSLMANFGLGGAFGLIKMPCVGGVYVAILGAMAESNDVKSGLPYLTAYNLGVILPVLGLGALLVFGLSPGKVDEFRRRHRVSLKLVSGVILIMMAGGFIFNVL
jgi:cytochrome c biogenesis protein CcdA